MKKLMLSAFLICSAVFMFGQSLSAYMSDGPRGNLHQLPNETNYRMAFNISGLATEQNAQEFIAKCKNYPGVVDVIMSNLNNDGKRPMILVLDSKKDELFFKEFLTNVNITKVYFKNKEYSTSTLSQLTADRKKAERNNQTTKKATK